GPPGTTERRTTLNTERKIRVAVVFGGRSSEHAISCLGAGNVLAALDRDRYEVVPVGIARDGRWILAPDDPGQLAIAGGELPSVEAMSAPGAEIAPPLDPPPPALLAPAPPPPPPPPAHA